MSYALGLELGINKRGLGTEGPTDTAVSFCGQCEVMTSIDDTTL